MSRRATWEPGIRWSRPVGAGVLTAAVVVGAIGFVPSAAEDRWWRDYAGGPESSRYFDSKDITKSNVADLTVAWTYPYGETGSNPIVVNGVVYGRGRNGAIVALDAKTGKEIWIHDGMQAMSARGMNYWQSADGKDRRLIFAMNDYLQEIDASTGLSIKTFGTDGVVDLREGLDRDPATIGRIQSGTPGKVFENLILIGSATGEGYMSPPGDVRAYDVVTGKRVWTFHTVPRPGQFGYDTWPKDAYKYIGGTNTWGEISVDAERGIAYFPTGSPTYDYYGADRPGANLFGNCLIALNARTGERLWHFQVVHHDLWDFDNNAAPQLTRIRHNGRDVDVVALAGKTGFLYVFDRVTGEPIWPIEERPVPKSEMPGEQSWPTQPFPTKPPPFSKQSFSEADINPHPTITDAAREAFKKRLKATRNMGLFTPIDFTDTLHIPGSNGGALFGYTASEPTTGNVYVISQDNPGVLKLLPPKPGGGAGFPGQAVYTRECQACHGSDRAGTQNGPTLLTVIGRVSPGDIRAVITSGKGRMPAFPHINDVDVDALIAYLNAPLPGGGRGRVSGPPPTFPPGPVVATGPARMRPAGRGRGFGPREYPEGVASTPQYVIDAYGTIGNMMKPPFTSLVKYDLNRGDIVWRVGLGDDARLAAHGITGTGVTQMRSSLIVTAAGLIFAPGGDSKVRAYDTETGNVLWTTALGGNIRGGPSMYEMDGRQYLLVHASGDMPDAALPPGSKPPSDLPRGYVAYALPAARSLAQPQAPAQPPPATRAPSAPPSGPPPNPNAAATAEDHEQMMAQLGIKALRPGPSGNESAPNHANYDEALANPYPKLPEVLTLENGRKVRSAAAWWKQRRPEIVELFDREVVGRVPRNVPKVAWRVNRTESFEVGGRPVVGKELIGTVDNSAHPEISVDIQMTLVTPANAKKAVPVMMMFGGRSGMPPAPGAPPPAARGFGAGRGGPGGAPGGPPATPSDPPATEQLIAAGWGYATISPASIQADNGAGLTRGIIGLANKGQRRKPDDWGSLRAWAWGASRGLDYLETDKTVDAKKVGIEGVSRYGKAALVTMAYDQRFAVVLIGSSGEGGAKLHRRNFGEAVENLTGSAEYHWMAGNFLKYGTEESTFGRKTAGDIPVDAHQLIALCAPRLTFISYGIPERGDAKWLDQQGSYMAAVASQPVFRLLGAKDLGVSDDYMKEKMPPVNHGMLDGQLAWRQHDGGHTDGPNWKYFIPWADRFLKHTSSVSK